MVKGRRLALPLLAAAAPLAAVALASTATLLTPQCPSSVASAAGTGGWITTGATEDPAYGGGAYPQYYNHGLSYAELGAAPGYPNYTGGLLAQALGLPADTYGLPAGFAILVRPVGSSSPGIRILKSDIGSGQAGEPHYTVDLHPRIATLLHFNGEQDIEVRVASNDPGAPPIALAAGCATAAGVYANPFAHTQDLIPERIDMGVDYDGQGEIDALGNARITFAATGIGGGWTCNSPENGGIVYRLHDGPDAGHYIYVTEDIIPAVRSGTDVAAGQEIGTFAPAGGEGCIETGFAAGPSPDPKAAALGQEAKIGDAGSNLTYCGLEMSNLLAAVDAPRGVTEGRRTSGTTC